MSSTPPETKITLQHLRMTTRRLRPFQLLPWAALLATAQVAGAATGTIFFNGAESVQSPITLRSVNSDGTGLRIVPVDLPEPAFPVISRDGRQLLLTSGDPGRPFKISRNIFSLDLATGGLAKVTSFEDSARSGTGTITTLTNGVASTPTTPPSRPTRSTSPTTRRSRRTDGRSPSWICPGRAEAL